MVDEQEQGMVQDKVLDRVRKLLELSKSDNANEAANALGAAQQLMAAHGIAEAQLAGDKPDDEIGTVERDLLWAGAARDTWRGHLAVVLADANQCICFRLGPDLHLIGHTRNRDTVRYLYTYASAEIERLCKAALVGRGGPGRTWANNFRLGAVQAISEAVRMATVRARGEARQAAREVGDTGAALTRVHTAIAKIDQQAADVKTWTKANIPLGSAKRTRTTFDPSARAAGYRAGQTVDLGRGRSGALPAGSRGALRS